MKLCLVESLYSLLWAVHRNFAERLFDPVLPRDGNYDIIASKKAQQKPVCALVLFELCMFFDHGDGDGRHKF